MRVIFTITIACIAALSLSGCETVSKSEEPENQVGNMEYPECPLTLTNLQGRMNADSTIEVSFTIHNLTDERITNATIRTYITSSPILDNVYEVARESDYSDTTIDCNYLTNRSDLNVHYNTTRAGKNSGMNFFFEVLDVTYYRDSLVKGSGWFQYDKTITLGQQ